MRPSFYPRLINDPFGDPGLFISLIFEKNAILFDLGDVYALSARDILKTGHAFISHTHMDHFIGFDRLLRLCLGREKNLNLYGPHGFLENIEGKLAGYSWNLVSNYSARLIIHATEVRQNCLISKEYQCRNRFLSTQKAEERPFQAILFKTPALTISTVILDHGIPCLGFSIEERFHVNIKKNKVDELGLQTGPWLRAFKQSLYTDPDLNRMFPLPEGKTDSKQKRYSLKELADQIATITPGQKVTYITDVSFHSSNIKKMIAFSKNSDHLFIEAAFLEKDRFTPGAKYHLTARQAGSIARKAGVKRMTLFHFSPRYAEHEYLLRNEAEKAFEVKNRAD
jgi:ribonuclease Z